MDAVAHRQGIGNGPKYCPCPAAVRRDGMPSADKHAGQNNIGIRLIIPEQDVVFGIQPFDQIVSSSSASASERVTVVSIDATCVSIKLIRGDGWVFWK